MFLPPFRVAQWCSLGATSSGYFCIHYFWGLASPCDPRQRPYLRLGLILEPPFFFILFSDNCSVSNHIWLVNMAKKGTVHVRSTDASATLCKWTVFMPPAVPAEWTSNRLISCHGANVVFFFTVREIWRQKFTSPWILRLWISPSLPYYSTTCVAQIPRLLWQVMDERVGWLLWS